MKHKFQLFIVLILTSSLAIAQDESEKQNYKHAIGFHYGMYSGWGNSYRFFPQKVGFQVNSMVYHQIYNSGTTLFSLGGSFMYSITRDKDFNLYAHVSSGYNYRKSRYAIFYDGYSGYNIKDNLSMGYGIGIDHTIGRFMMNAYYAMGFRRNFEVYSMWGFGGGLYYQF
jgi:hypothetical protein